VGKARVFWERLRAVGVFASLYEEDLHIDFVVPGELFFFGKGWVYMRIGFCPNCTSSMTRMGQ